MSDYSIAVKYAMIFFMVTMAIEWVLGKWMKKNIYNPMDTISSISSGMTNNVKSILKLSIVIISYQWMFDYIKLFEIGSQWYVYVIAFLGIDFASYWSHRWNHEYNILWNKHIIHHSSEEFNLACALRQSISDVLHIYFFLYIPMALIGVPPKVISILLPLHLFAQFWYHTRLIGKMGFLEHIIVTPSHHRVHHAINERYIDKNYAAIFIFWDKWFGTFQEELIEEPAVYGIKKPAKTWNPIVINYMHMFQLLKDAWHTKNWIDKIKIWFMPTGWRPNDVKNAHPLEVIQDPYSYKKYNTKKDTLLLLWSSFQLIFHLGMQFHLIYIIGYIGHDFSYDQASFMDIINGYQIFILYGIFFILSVWSLTSLMDRSPMMYLPIEIIKLFVGIYLISSQPEILSIYENIYIPKLIIMIYLGISLSICVYYSLLNKEKPEPGLSN